MVTDPIKLRKKKELIEQIQIGIKAKYHERYEKIYDSVLARDNIIEWLSVKDDY